MVQVVFKLIHRKLTSGISFSPTFSLSFLTWICSTCSQYLRDKVFSCNALYVTGLSFVAGLVPASKT